MTQIKLTPRLRAAADMVRQGSYVADIGSDHAYLPIAIYLEGRIRGGVASDINEGPVRRGAKNIKEYGLEGKIVSIRADGLDGIQDHLPDTVLILGMGGELIASILEKAPWTRDKNIRLCLQPMTHPELLRAFLRDGGYSITDEVIVREDERIYQIISACYSGISEDYTAAELLLGKINIAKKAEWLVPLAVKHISVLKKRISGKSMAGEDTAAEEALLSELEEIIATFSAQ